MHEATLHLTGNSHIDAAWLWPWTETVDTVKHTFSTALQLMNEYPTYTYTQSAAAYNDWMARDYPEIDAQIKQRIKEGRWEVVGGMWVEPDLNMPDGESTTRSILIGKRWYEQHYGVDVRIGWNPDSFGYNWQLPQIYKKIGHRLFRHAEDGVERHESAAVQAVLVGVAGRKQGADVLPARLCEHESESGAAECGSGEGAGVCAGTDEHDGPVRGGRSRRRPDAGNAGRGPALDAARQGGAA